jgi:hypothetical protein
MKYALSNGEYVRAEADQNAQRFGMDIKDSTLLTVP